MKMYKKVRKYKKKLQGRSESRNIRAENRGGI